MGAEIFEIELADFRTDKQLELMEDLRRPTALRIIHETLLPYINECVPMNSGFLSRNRGNSPGNLRAHHHVTSNGITWKTKYSDYVWNGDGYGPHIPIHPKGDPNTIIGFYSKPTQFPTGKALNYTTPGTGDHWINLFVDKMHGSYRSYVNNAVTRALKNYRGNK